MFLKHLYVKTEIPSLMILIFICIHFHVLLWPDDGPRLWPKLVAA